MSDTVLKFIPVDQNLVPPSEVMEDAASLMEELFPEGGDAEAEAYEHVVFIDNGTNLEAVVCSACAKRLEIFTKDHEDRFPGLFEFIQEGDDASLAAANIEMPCCHKSVSVTSLTFDWPAGFARFELSVWNPACPRPVPASAREKIEALLGCAVLEIWAHY